MTKQTTWIDYFGNAQAVRGLFGEAIPELRGLKLRQLILDAGGGLSFNLELHTLPDPLPSKWKDRGVDKLQLRIFLVIGDLAIRRGDRRGPWNVSVEFEGKQLNLMSEDGSFELTGGIVSLGRLAFFPYRAKDYEFPPEWVTPYF